MATPVTPEFRQWTDRVMAALLPTAKAIIASGRQHVPMIAVFRNDGVVMAPIPFQTMGHKDAVALMHRDIASTPGVDGAILILEAWAKEFEPGETPKFTGLANEPGRTEMLSFNILRGDMQLCLDYPILRPSNTLGEPRITDPGEPGSISYGRFILNEPIRH